MHIGHMRAVFVLLLGVGHLIPTGDDEAGGHDSVEATLEHCRAQNRQLISEMRESTSVDDYVLVFCFHLSLTGFTVSQQTTIKPSAISRTRNSPWG